MVPRGSNALRGITDPYRYVVHTASRLPWVHHVLTAYRQSVPCTWAARRCRKKQRPGLNGPDSLRATTGHGGHPATSLLYLRLFEPGSQRPSRGIRGKCWIGPGPAWPVLARLSGPEMVNIVLF